MKEARTAYQLLDAIELLSDLLWDRYGDQLIQIYRQEQQNEPWWQDPLDPFHNVPEDNPKETP